MDLINNDIKTGDSHLRNIITLRVIVISLFIVILSALLIIFRISVLKSEKKEDLSAIARLKSVQLSQWHNERLSEVEFFSMNSLVTGIVNQDSKENFEEYSNKLEKLFSPFLDFWRYENVFILSDEGEVIFSLRSDSLLINSDMKEKTGIVLKEGNVKLFGFEFCKIHKAPHFDIAAPIRLEDGTIKGVLLFRTDPDAYLFPLIQTWPTSSRTSEIILVQKQGDSIEFINRLRHSDYEPLEYKVHVSNTDMPAVKAVAGHEGFFDGRDYRGISVLACLSAVDQTPWFMVTKIDKSEMYSELYPEAFMLLIVMVLLISLTWAIFSFLQNKKQGLIYKTLWETEAKYKAFFDNSMDAIMITQPDGAILSANPAACKLFGYSEEEIISLGRSGIVDITDPMLPVLIERRKREGKVISELNFVRNDGTIFTAEFTSAIFEDSRGEKKSSLIIRDMTKRKEDEKKIIELNDHLNSLINTLKELSASHDMLTIQKVITMSARELTDSDGVTFVVRDGDFCLFAEENAVSPLWKGQRLNMNECICGWAMLNKQTVMIRDVMADPRINAEHYKNSFVKSLVVVPVNTDNFASAIGIYWSSGNLPSDIEIRLLESLSDAAAVAFENVRLYEDLEARVKDRTTQLTAANKELEAFSYSVSHDLRAPLRAINGFAKILSEEFGGNMGEKEKKLFSLIHDNAAKMDQLINDLLAFSKLGRKEPKKSFINMGEMVNSVYDEVIDNKLREVVVIQIEGIPDAYGDANMIRQVWTNLISNAVKFSSKKETPHIRISGEQTGNKTVYVIRDNGAGFDMNYSTRLFQVFQRLHSSADFDGTGVGLALIQRIISRHGGEVWAEGEVGKGATFWFSLPAGGK